MACTFSDPGRDLHAPRTYPVEEFGLIEPISKIPVQKRFEGQRAPLDQRHFCIRLANHFNASSAGQYNSPQAQQRLFEFSWLKASPR
ncbi:hypothetical protein BQ8482_480107 [Mesorhizobium delmotii]|uniref:Uncharacterized protein n=1 Tax=Mesorhizobium delmotii TaxID=1631247 RepID=A0A2P9AU30_9HYPH|nr:hypothetical protein BQ8482_480107 [Mesorhizobium delmotii]